MKNRLTVDIAMDQFLIDFLYAVYQPQHLNDPLYLPRRNRLNILLSKLLVKRPPNYLPEQNLKQTKLRLIIPYFEYMNINSYNHLSDLGQRIFTKRVKTIFYIEFFDFVDSCLIEGVDKIESVNLFIEKYNLPDDLTFLERLLKKLQRSKKILKKHPKKIYKKRSV